jgi:hypothetical protein
VPSPLRKSAQRARRRLRRCRADRGAMTGDRPETATPSPAATRGVAGVYFFSLR